MELQLGIKEITLMATIVVAAIAVSNYLGKRRGHLISIIKADTKKENDFRELREDFDRHIAEVGPAMKTFQEMQAVVTTLVESNKQMSDNIDHLFKLVGDVHSTAKSNNELMRNLLQTLLSHQGPTQ